VREFKPDVVQVQTIHNFIGLEPALWLQRNHVPHCWAIMDYYPFCGPRMLLKGRDESCPAVEGTCDGQCPGGRADPRLLEAVNGSPVVALNRFSADIYRRNGMRCDYVVELGVDTEMFRPDASQRNCAVGVYTSTAWAMHPAKGMHVLQAAIQGAGHDVNVLTGLPREAIAQQLRKADVYVFPSCYQETWGLCLNEAMASGCACVASDVAGARAQITPGVDGVLVPPRDAVALRSAIEMLVGNAEWRDMLGANARAEVLRDHTLEAMGRRWERVYEDVMSRR